MAKIKRSVTIELDAASWFKKSRTPIPELVKAARRLTRQTKRHFEEDGWDLEYNSLVTDVFYEAFGHHLENYLWKALHRQNVAVVLTCKSGRSVLSKLKPRKKAAKK